MNNIIDGKKAWMLIKQAGCENFKECDALISKKHCNFFVNNGNANSADIERLINKVKQTVYKKTGINLDHIVPKSEKFNGSLTVVPLCE